MSRKRGYLLILLAAVIYSTTEVALKGLGNVFAPMQLTVERVLIGGLFLLPFAMQSLRSRHLQLERADWNYFLLLGFLTVLIHMSFLQLAVLHMDASAASAIYSGNPIFTFFFSYFILHTPIRRFHIVAALLQLVGIIFILNPAHLEISLRGFVEIIIATICIALYSVLGKLRLDRLGSTVITSMNFLVGGCEMLLLLLIGKFPPIAKIFDYLGLGLFANVSLTSGFTLPSTLLLLYVGVVVVGIGFLLMLRIVECTSAAESSFVFLCKPPIAAVFAYLFLHEKISLHRMIGILFFLLASLCVTVCTLRETENAAPISKSS